MNIIPTGKVQDLLDHGFNFERSFYFSEGLELFKKDAGQFSGYGFLYCILAVIAAYVPFGSLLLTPSLTVGFTLGAHKVSRREPLDFGVFFKGFDYFLQLLLYTLFVGLISLVVIIPFIIIMFVGGAFFGIGSELVIGLMAIIFILLFMGGLTAIRTIYIFSQHFIVFGKMEAWQAMETSRKIITQNFWPIFGMVLLLGLMNLGGFLLCGLGLVITIPLSQCIIYVAFRELVNLDNFYDESDHDILNHLVD